MTPPESDSADLRPVGSEASPKPSAGEIGRLTKNTLEHAVRSDASDIHLNSTGEGVLVRFRVNGLLRDVQLLSRDVGRRLIHRLKALAGMNIIERRRPQDGRVLLRLDGGDVDFRLATIYSLWGENLAIRIFDKSRPNRQLHELGLHREGYQILHDLIHSPLGMVLVTGPTGAGKTATLYAALEEIKRPEINIITVEDPVEHEIRGVNQIGVQPKIGVGFIECLRSAFRQDPDVLMIGEIRDTESAMIAIRAALSGHLVLSTLHTGTAAEAVAALIHLGIEPFLLSTSLIGVLAQQLVRTICPGCRADVPLDINPTDLSGVYRNEFLRAREGGGDVSFSYGEGCERCFASGYLGRTGLFEILRITPGIRKRILQKASKEDIEEAALSDGMMSMRTLGIRLVIAGITTIEEVLRVVPVPEEEYDQLALA